MRSVRRTFLSPIFKEHPAIVKAFSSRLVFLQKDFIRSCNVSLLLVVIPRFLGTVTDDYSKSISLNFAYSVRR